MFVAGVGRCEERRVQRVGGPIQSPSWNAVVLRQRPDKPRSAELFIHDVSTVVFEPLTSIICPLIAHVVADGIGQLPESLNKFHFRGGDRQNLAQPSAVGIAKFVLLLHSRIHARRECLGDGPYRGVDRHAKEPGYELPVSIPLSAKQPRRNPSLLTQPK